MLINILLFVNICSLAQNISNSEKLNDNFYLALNEIIASKLKNVSTVKCETQPIFRTIWGNSPIPTNANTSPPVPIEDLSWSFFMQEIESHQFGSLEARYMYLSIDSTKYFKLDSTKVNRPLISKINFDKLFSGKDFEEGYIEIKKKYGSSCFIQVSTPVFNKNFTKQILFVSYCCGPVSGTGYVFILEKRKSKWIIIKTSINWIS